MERKIRKVTRIQMHKRDISWPVEDWLGENVTIASAHWRKAVIRALSSAVSL
jgi:hypothetical protein